ncbi:Pyridoxal-5'-phosphate-dependent enzyme, beta subunit [Thermoproteus uzoniensis 768-20]|uniref:Pyridoxal-5'-phosphate-dependent enzyme, beta subunit n=1 Tax=Thermoproteus uzoniensis (strain 768-20) TaxID=999630 RepID=F2L0F7_THEU7|nr:pyridoxal-phosphate dependent enzyme [Thermoproteus uzoniensis]AEA12639.1 Pyridoxal-5'-phosphate-dependent enzyme, beta subunit [Thermoproteus uzoniensis 768-20]
MLECLPHLEKFIREGRYVADGASASCFSALFLREVKAGETLRVEDLYPQPDARRVYDRPLDLLLGGWPTPLLKVGEAPREAWAKLEWYNPFSRSIKDRTTYALVRSVEGDRLVEVSSGNVAIALGVLGILLGKKVKIYLPSAAKYVEPVLDVLGVEHEVLDVTMTIEALEHIKGDVAKGAVHTNQFENDANFFMHIRTAVEIDWQLSSRGIKPSYVIAGAGTSGHSAALGFYFGAKYGARLVAVQPSDWIPGLRRTESGMKWIKYVPAEVVDVSFEQALEGIKTLARRYGLLAGLSSGAVYFEYLRRRSEGVYLMVFPDDIYKYLDLLKYK